jgi:hypothetical protein
MHQDIWYHTTSSCKFGVGLGMVFLHVKVGLKASVMSMCISRLLCGPELLLNASVTSESRLIW